MSKDFLVKISLLTFFLAFCVVVLGAYTRLVHAGLGCPDWPTCYGHFWVPNSEGEIAAANSVFQDTPVETDKTWPEQLHRWFASSLGLLISFLLVGFAKIRYKEGDKAKVIVSSVLYVMLFFAVAARIGVGDKLDPFLWILIVFYFANVGRFALKQAGSSMKYSLPFLLPVTLAGMVVLQGFFGMWTVTLKLWPQVVTAHLLGGFTTLSLLFVLCARLTSMARIDQTIVNFSRIKTLSLVAVTVLIVQISLGGWTSSNYAALACPDFPLCQNQIVPEADFLEGFNVAQEIGPNYLGGVLDNTARVAIHFAHRVGALITSLILVVLAFMLFKTGNSVARQHSVILMGLLVFQVSLGVSNIVFALPLSVAVLHNLGGALLLLAMVKILYLCFKNTSRKHESI